MLQKVTQENEREIIKRPAPQLKRGEGARVVFNGRIFKVWQWDQQLYDGSTSIYESLSRNDTVTMLAFTEEGKLVMTRQIQPSVAKEFWSFPGGIVDDGESILEASKRELLEETGCSSDEWYFLFAEQFSGKIDWTNFYLVAKNCKIVDIQHPDAGEKIDLEFFNFKDLDNLIKTENFRQKDFVIWYLNKGGQAEVEKMFA